MASQDSKFCLYCQGNTLHVRDKYSNNFGCLLTIITCGIFLPVWIILALWHGKKWRCQQCGNVFETGSQLAPSANSVSQAPPTDNWARSDTLNWIMVYIIVGLPVGSLVLVILDLINYQVIPYVLGLSLLVSTIAVTRYLYRRAK